MFDVLCDWATKMDLTNIFYDYATTLSKITGIYAVYCFFHYTIPHLYTYFCTPTTFWGFLISPFMSQAPHCVAMRWTLYNVGDNIKTMFALVAGWLSGMFFSKIS